MRLAGAWRRHARGAAAIAIVVPLGFLARLPRLDPAERAEMAARFRFERLELPAVAGVELRPSRPVHPSLAHVQGWINVLGAGVALDDLDGDGLANDLCWSDPRADRVLVAPAPGTGERYAPFALDAPAGSETTAPMGCLTGDLNEDGLVDLLVYFWGRPPVAHLRREGSELPAPDAYLARELGDPGERWYTNAALFADLDGDGHQDLVLGNYFQDGARILDPGAGGTVEMHDSMTRAHNGGRNRLLLFAGGQGGPEPEVRFADASDALDEDDAHAWTLAAGAADLDGDLLPELYFANDFGPDLLLHNRSTPGRLSLEPVRGARSIAVPRSKTLGHDSFKGMGVDFGDLNGDGLLDVYASNITTEYGLQESQFAWISTGEPERLREGRAPYVDRSEELGLSRSGWAWEARLADFDNDGVLEALQALGFLRGAVDRWPELHEVAMGNDQLLSSPASWHRFSSGDDLSGRDPSPFFVRASSGRYFDLAAEVGLGRPRIGRAIATADVDGDGDLDLAFGNQWEPSALYRNDSPAENAFLGLHLLLPVEGDAAPTRVRAGHPGPERARAAVGAHATVRLPDGRALASWVDGGSGHSGKRAKEVHFGLGELPADAKLEVELAWRDERGETRRATLALGPGWHTVLLGSDA